MGLVLIPPAKIIRILETYHYSRKKTAQTIPNLCGFLGFSLQFHVSHSFILTFSISRFSSLTVLKKPLMVTAR